MTPCTHPTQPCRAVPTPVSSSNVWLDIEVLAERYEDLLALPPLEDESSESEPQEADDAEDEASDDLPF